MRATSRLIAAVAGLGLAAAACGSSHGPANPAAAASVKEGTALIDVAGQAQVLSIQRCVQAGGGTINLTAIGTGTPRATLTVNLAPELAASTMVLTTIDPDNTYTNYNMASTAGAAPASGGRHASQLSLSGKVNVEGFTATGQQSGRARQVPASLVASCPSIIAEQPAPVYADGKPG